MPNTQKLSKDEIEANKIKIIELFNSKVKGRTSNVAKSNLRHDGKHGHWLEHEMGVAFNSSNSPDILGFEMKNATTGKTTFGDWSGDYRIYSIKEGGSLTRDEFLSIFGHPNPAKNGRFSWSGRVCPNKPGPYNKFGQRMIIGEESNISIIYEFNEDKRPDKYSIVPEKFRNGIIVLERWSAAILKQRVESKFNQNGWFKCEKDNRTGLYDSIVFGEPITFETWISFVKNGDVIFDCGMYQGNVRPYHNWRASNNFWVSLITSRY
ncbi:MAG TPA: LlaMI family restriction endonuclease, partial [Candidatus Saccharimonadia bacterium]|nr:LlaMI family restriction endonuclease [Candidatus Saccharimonadia bacterium]